MSDKPPREGSLDAPTRLPIEWRSDEFHDEESLYTELERVFDICHGCRRCFSLCNAFPTLFDAVDESDSGELDSVPRTVYWEVVDHCYLCDMCYMSKCPYVPPHEWAVDFPHLMLRAKSRKFRTDPPPVADRLLANTDLVGRLAGIPVVSETMNAVTGSRAGRKLLDAVAGVDQRAPLPRWHRDGARERLSRTLREREPAAPAHAGEANGTTGRVVLFTTCYGNRNAPEICEDLAAVFGHNGIDVALLEAEQCCGMPRLELGDLDGVAAAMAENVPRLAGKVREGYDITAPIPSCVLMFKQELPLMFPDDPDVAAVAEAFYDPFEYLMLRHRAGRLDTVFSGELGKVSYQVPCHLRVQNIGLKTREVLELVPGTDISVIERCSGHDGTYGVKKRFREASEKIARPVIRRAAESGAPQFTSDCPMAGAQIAAGLDDCAYAHPLSLLRRAYGIPA